MLLPLAAVGSLAAVLLAGLVFWGLDSSSVKAPGRELVSASHHPSESAVARIKSPPSGGERKAHTESTELDPPPHPPRNGAEKPPRQGPPAAEPPRESEPRAIPQKDLQAEHPSEEKLALSVASPPRPEAPVSAPPPRPTVHPPLARVAIVIDDLGRDLTAARILADLPISITFSVLPFEDQSREVMALARARGREVMLHMPMEPEGYPQVSPGRGALLAAMNSRDIQRSFRAALENAPSVRGINNHMGSRFTEQEASMDVVMKELRHRRLFFLDSATTIRSVGVDVARRHGVPFLRRDVFLDHVLSESFVRAQIGQLIRRARVQGMAVAIGHPHEVTIKVLKEESQAFEREKVAVVPASQLLFSPPSKP